MGAAALLQAFTEGHEHFHQLLLTVQATDWEKPSYHRRGNMSVGQYITAISCELSRKNENGVTLVG